MTIRSLLSSRLEELPVEQGAALAEYRRYREAMAVSRLQSLVPTSVRLSQPPATRLSNGRNPFDMMLFGSTANQLVRRAGCPVLTIRR